MKKIIIILGMCFSLACGKDEAPQGENPRPQTQLNDTTIIYGTWKHVKGYEFSISHADWISFPVEDSIEFTFERDGSFKSSRPTIFHEKCFPSHFKIFNNLSRKSSVSNNRDENTISLISMTYGCLKKDVDEQFLNSLNEYDRLLKSDIRGYNTRDLNLYTLINENHILFNSIYIYDSIKNNRLYITGIPTSCYEVFQKILE